MSADSHKPPTDTELYQAFERILQENTVQLSGEHIAGIVNSLKEIINIQRENLLLTAKVALKENTVEDFKGMQNSIRKADEYLDRTLLLIAGVRGADE